MLSSIQIKDFAIIDRIELELAPGMTAMTGETGAGKSIMVDALLFVVGGRAGTDIIRHGCDKAEVTASFTLGNNPLAAAWFKEQDLDSSSTNGDECVLRRLMGSDGRSRAWVNGQSMPVQALRQLGETLVDVHGQMEYQSLMKRTAQRELLDQHGQHISLLNKVSGSWQELKALRVQRDETERSAQDRNERLNLLHYHLSELQALAPQANEAAELAAERLRHTQSGKLAQGVREIADLLREAEGNNAEHLLSRALNMARQLGTIDTRLGDTLKLLDEALIATREAADAIQHYESELDADPARQEWVEQRLAALESAARKHRVEVDGLLQVQAECQQEVARLESLEFTLEQLNALLATASKQFATDCQSLSKARKKTAATLTERVSNLMQGLGMPGGRFAVEVRALGDDDANEWGADEVEFMVSANPGQPLKPLAKVASGGELSRISLSIQVAAVESIPCPTLVFDEVDAGVGGGVAEMVGRQLRALAERGIEHGAEHSNGASAQVLCVTHLPQVASQAHAQVRVAKLTDGKHTRTSLETLSSSARVEEIARMLGGAQVSDMARSHAAEMLNVPTAAPAKPARASKGKGK